MAVGIDCAGKEVYIEGTKQRYRALTTAGDNYQPLQPGKSGALEDRQIHFQHL